MKLLKLISTWLLMAASLSSCMVADANSVKALGGKLGYRSTEGGFAVVWNGEKSFYHASVLAGTIATTVASASAAAAEQATQQVVAREGTKQFAAQQATQQATVQAGAGVVNTANQLNTAAELAPAQIVTPAGY